jgi:AmmeMemoRadiSam system protein A
LEHARQALEEGVLHHRQAEVLEPQGALRENHGAFVTLRKAGRLRGCIGYVEALKPLYQTARECAAAAALRDPRFNPVTPEELPDLRVEVSVLSPLVDLPIDQIEIGHHGLQVSRGFQRGVLLPQVAVECKWDRRRFLEETCIKAGLPPDAWRHGVRIQAFTVQVCSEPPELACTPARFGQSQLE